MKRNLNNYEEWFVAFIDNELDEQEVKSLHAFLVSHPKLKQELDTYKNTQLTFNKALVFEGKETLLKEESPLIAWKKLWPLAAAVLLALVIIPFLGGDKTTPEKVVKSKEQTATQKDTNAVLAHQMEVKKEGATKVEPIEPAPIVEQTPTKSKKRQTLVQRKTKKNIAPVQKTEKEETNIPQKTIDVPLQQVVVQETKQNKPEPKKYLQEKKNNALPKDKAVAALPQEKENKKAPVEQNGLIVINEDHNPLIHQKLNETITKVEEKINTIKEIKKTPITVCIGKRKLFTINN